MRQPEYPNHSEAFPERCLGAALLAEYPDPTPNTLEELEAQEDAWEAFWEDVEDEK